MPSIREIAEACGRRRPTFTVFVTLQSARKVGAQACVCVYHSSAFFRKKATNRTVATVSHYGSLLQLWACPALSEPLWVTLNTFSSSSFFPNRCDRSDELLQSKDASRRCSCRLRRNDRRDDGTSESGVDQ